MSDDTQDLAERALARRKREDRAFVLPVLGVILLASPLLNIVSGRAELFGMPLVFLYIFAVWVAFILVTRALARRLLGGGG